jgi:hypothetical protein
MTLSGSLVFDFDDDVETIASSDDEFELLDYGRTFVGVTDRQLANIVKSQTLAHRVQR